MRKTVAITMEKELWIKTKQYLLTEKRYNLSYFIESLITKYFDELESIEENQTLKGKQHNE